MSVLRIAAVKELVGISLDVIRSTDDDRILSLEFVAERSASSRILDHRLRMRSVEPVRDLVRPRGIVASRLRQFRFRVDRERHGI